MLWIPQIPKRKPTNYDLFLQKTILRPKCFTLKKCAKFKGQIAVIKGENWKSRVVYTDFQKWRYFCCDMWPNKDMPAIYGPHSNRTRNMNERKLLQRKMTSHMLLYHGKLYKSYCSASLSTRSRLDNNLGMHTFEMFHNGVALLHLNLYINAQVTKFLRYIWDVSGEIIK